MRDLLRRAVGIDEDARVAAPRGGSTALVAGVALAMTAAGMVFCWLRIRSRSLVAPFVVHWWINATAFVVAWAVSR